MDYNAPTGSDNDFRCPWNRESTYRVCDMCGDIEIEIEGEHVGDLFLCLRCYHRFSNLDEDEQEEILNK